jgi:hypothetical protein
LLLNRVVSLADPAHHSTNAHLLSACLLLALLVEKDQMRKRIGCGAVCSVLLKYLHPGNKINPFFSKR